MKKAISLLLALLMCLGLAATALAADPASGKCGANLTWSLSADGTLTISGTGPMDDYFRGSSTPWYDQRWEIFSLVVEKGVTTIGANAFNGCYKLADVEIPDGVTTIGEAAFRYCNMKEVTLPDSVTSIGDLAFSDCGCLNKVNIPEGVTSIGKKVFYLCYLTSMVIPDNITSIGESAFEKCLKLTSVTIPDSVTSIGESAFADCNALKSVAIPDSITSIPDFMFHGCIGLTGVTIPDSVTSIGIGAFLSCESLTGVTIPDGVTTIQNGTFNSCYSMTSVVIPDSVTEIKWWAFAYCNRLADVYYGGREKQWKQIKIDEEDGGNAPLLDAEIHYNSTGPAPLVDTVPSTDPTPSADTVPPASDGISVTVNGAAVAWTDAEPFIDGNDRTMVPLRAVADAMGLDVNWDAAAREASFTGSGNTIIFPIDSSTARTSDGSEVTMDTAAVIANERTYAPIRYLAEYFGHKVEWDAAARTVVIT